MKTLITLLTATTLLAGVTTAMADQQASDEAASNALSHQTARGPYASVRGAETRSTVTVPSTIDFQAQGSR